MSGKSRNSGEGILPGPLIYFSGLALGAAGLVAALFYRRTLAWSFAPQTDRKQLVTLRKTALGRSACSDALLVGLRPAR